MCSRVAGSGSPDRCDGGTGHDAGWIDRNPAMAVKPSKVGQNPTLPFSDEEVERILDAARTLSTMGRHGPKIEPMVLLLRYSGVRIQDAACLERARACVTLDRHGRAHESIADEIVKRCHCRCSR